MSNPSNVAELIDSLDYCELVEGLKLHYTKEQLQRIMVPVDQWMTGDFCDAEGKRCLFGHIEGWRYDYEDMYYYADEEVVDIRHAHTESHLPSRFDRLCKKFGLELVVTTIQSEIRTHIESLS